MKFLVVGAGAMGCLFTGLLARAGHETALLEAQPERVQAIRDCGIRIKAIAGPDILVPETLVYGSVPEGYSADMILLSVKSYDTGRAVQSSLPALGPGTVVVTLQNGLGNIEAIERHVPLRRILAGTTAQGATLLGHGSVRHAGSGDTVVGALATEAAGAARDLCRALDGAGIPASFSPDIRPALWAKLLVNAGINALTAIMDVPNGMIVQDEHLRAVMRRAVLEGAEIAGRMGIELPHADPVARAEEVCRATAENISSMLQDRRCGRRTEIDSINGALESCGSQLGIPTPVNSTLAGLVRSFGVTS